jgi:type II secretory pathway pseudopilin PulG
MTRTQRRAAGFTLVELTVALVAGLIVAIAIVGLSKAATATFHEEIRSSAAEATLRAAADRLRADLQRAAYMSTPNIISDPLVAKWVGDPNNIFRVNATTGGGIMHLAGVHLLAGGSAANAPLSTAQTPALNPDAIEIGGNMTSAEQFDVQSINVNNGVCARITISDNSPAMYRINAAGPAAQAAEFNNIFQPYPGYQFIVRLLDDTGRSQFLSTCPETTPTGINNTAVPPTAYVDVASAVAQILTPQDTGNLGGVNPVPAGRAWINPVQLVHWQIMNAAAEPAQIQNALGTQSLAAAVDPNKYDLVRSYVDATGTIIPQTSEVVAEYAVDLKFAFSVEGSLVKPPTPPQPTMLTLAFDDPTNQTWADDVYKVQGGANMPQRIRIVRARIATRTAQPDRTVNVPVANVGVQAFMYRYCMTAGACTTQDGTLRWARVRTITTEVSLANQAGAFY